MATREPRTDKNALLQCLGGMDAGRSPSLIADDQVAWAVNLTMRGGFPRTRPGFPRRTIQFQRDEQSEWYHTHILQGGYVYRTKAGNFFVVSVGGRFFKIAPLNNYTVTELTPTKGTTTAVNFNAPAIDATVTITLTNASEVFVGYPIYINGAEYMVTAKAGNDIDATNVDDTPAALVTAGAIVIYLDPNSPNQDTVWFEQATKWLIAQDGQGAPMLFDGATMRRASYADAEKPEVPVGRMMVYAGNRLHVATLADQVALGDIAGGPTDVIVFAEELAISGTARFQIDGEITAMVKSVTLDTSLGQGPVQIFTRDSAHSLNLPAQRAVWPTLTYALQTYSLTHAGALSHYGTVNVNSDIWYRAKDGWRTFALSRRDYSKWGSVPVSSEIQPIIDDEEQSLLHKGTAMLFGNRLIMATQPRRASNGSIYHRAMVVMDFDLISRMGNTANPAYDGLWTGIRPTLLLQGEFGGVERGFAFALNADEENELWEIDARRDDDEGGPIKSVLETRAMFSSLERKKLWGAELWVDDVREQVDFTLKYGTDQSPCKNLWGQKTICTPIKDCLQNEDDCKELENRKPGYRTRKGFGQPSDDDCDSQNKTPSRTGYEFQLRLEWIGHCRVRKLLAKSNVVEEEPDAPCEDEVANA